VPTGYLVTAALAAVCTLFALAPVRLPSPLGRLSGTLGLVVNELPFVAFYWLVASTLLAIAQGDIDSPGGWLGFGVAVVATTGLAVVAWRGLQAGPAIDTAMNAGLDAGWRAAIDPELSARLRRRLPLARILFGPFLVRRRDVERVANIRYGDAGAANQLDLYRHRSHPAGGPILIHLHGGAFVGGRKNREARPLIYHLASQGWLCISANYRLSPAATFPDHLFDVKKVIAWVREHGQDYGGDPAVVFVAGSSAGGHLAALAALTPNDPYFQQGFEHVDTSVNAAVCLYGYYGPLERAERPPSSPLAYVGAGAPPFFIAHGDKDTRVPVDGARLFVDRLQSTSSRPVVYTELPGAQHAFDLFHSLRVEAVVDAIEAFAAWVRSQGDAARQALER
jgi:acetyl esterase/lipase